MPESNYDIMDENDIRLRLKKLKKDYQVKVGEVYEVGSSYGDPEYYCCLRVDFDKVQMICIQSGRNDKVYGRHIMFWENSRRSITELKVENGRINTLEVTKVADTLEQFYQKKFNGEL